MQYYVEQLHFQAEIVSTSQKMSVLL